MLGADVQEFIALVEGYHRLFVDKQGTLYVPTQQNTNNNKEPQSKLERKLQICIVCRLAHAQSLLARPLWMGSKDYCSIVCLADQPPVQLVNIFVQNKWATCNPCFPFTLCVAAPLMQSSRPAAHNGKWPERAIIDHMYKLLSIVEDCVDGAATQCL